MSANTNKPTCLSTTWSHGPHDDASRPNRLSAFTFPKILGNVSTHQTIHAFELIPQWLRVFMQRLASQADFAGENGLLESWYLGRCLDCLLVSVCFHRLIRRTVEESLTGNSLYESRNHIIEKGKEFHHMGPFGSGSLGLYPLLFRALSFWWGSCQAIREVLHFTVLGGWGRNEMGLHGASRYTMPMSLPLSWYPSWAKGPFVIERI